MDDKARRFSSETPSRRLNSVLTSPCEDESVAAPPHIENFKLKVCDASVFVMYHSTRV